MTQVLIAFGFCVTAVHVKSYTGFVFLAETLPTTELNYESLADVWKYIIEKLHTSTVLFGIVCVCNVQLLDIQFVNDLCLHSQCLY